MTRQMLSISVAGLISTAAYVWLMILSGSGRPVALSHFLAAFGVAAGCWGWACWSVRRNSGANVTWIILWGLAFRLVGFFGQPLYEDDYFRYLWDGRAFAIGGNPYQAPPAKSFGDSSLPEEFQEVLDGISYPEIQSPYGPTCQWAFRAAYHLAPGKLWSLKLIFALADIVVMSLLLGLLARRQNIVIYAWCPLLIKEVAFTAHAEILGVALAVAALALAKARRSLPYCWFPFCF